MHLIRSLNLTDPSFNDYPDTYNYLSANHVLHAVIKNGSIVKLTRFDSVVWQR